MLQWWSNDQTFFNEVLHRAGVHLALKLGTPAERREAEDLLVQSTRHPTKLARLEADLTKLSSLRARDALTYAQVRGILFKKVRLGEQRVGVSVATFPFKHFASGHTYFTQSLQDRMGFVPVAVHTTFQFGDTAEFAWGKRSRLREKLLWKVDSDDYFTRRGSYSPGKGADEAAYNGFIQLTGDVGLIRWPLDKYDLTSFSIKLEGMPSYIGRALSSSGSVSDFDRGDPHYHLILDSFQRRLIHNVLALGRATMRKVCALHRAALLLLCVRLTAPVATPTHYFLLSTFYSLLFHRAQGDLPKADLLPLLTTYYSLLSTLYFLLSPFPPCAR